MAISDIHIRAVVKDYLTRYPDDVDSLAEAVRLLGHGADFASRHTFPMHVTVGALLVRGDQVLLVDHRAYGIRLQPGGHLEPDDNILLSAALRELAEETGINTARVTVLEPAPVYIEYGPVPARPARGEPAHFHLDLGFAFAAPACLEVGALQDAEVTGAGWYPLAVAERLVGSRISRAVHGPAGIG